MIARLFERILPSSALKWGRLTKCWPWETDQPRLSHDVAFGTPGHRSVFRPDPERMFPMEDRP